MPDAELRFSLSKVKHAGKVLRAAHSDPFKIAQALEVFENWQACHGYPMNWFRESLSESAKAFSPLTNVVHRRKRLDTIIAKLRK